MHTFLVLNECNRSSQVTDNCLMVCDLLCLNAHKVTDVAFNTSFRKLSYIMVIDNLESSIRCIANAVITQTHVVMQDRRVITYLWRAAARPC